MAIDPNPTSSIPIIDFGPLRSGRPEDAQVVGKAVYEAFRDYGFAYLINHGIDQAVVDEAFKWVCLHAHVLKLGRNSCGNEYRVPNSSHCPKRLKTRHRILPTAGGIAATPGLAGRK